VGETFVTVGARLKIISKDAAPTDERFSGTRNAAIPATQQGSSGSSGADIWRQGEAYNGKPVGVEEPQKSPAGSVGGQKSDSALPKEEAVDQREFSLSPSRARVEWDGGNGKRYRSATLLSFRSWRY